MNSGKNEISSPTMQNIFWCNIKLLFFKYCNFQHTKTFLIGQIVSILKVDPLNFKNKISYLAFVDFSFFNQRLTIKYNHCIVHKI